MKTYIAYTTGQKAYICQAKSKVVMRKSGMNMSLDWQTVKDFETAQRIILCDGYTLINSTKL
jgi:hypothetical protein